MAGVASVKPALSKDGLGVVRYMEVKVNEAIGKVREETTCIHMRNGICCNGVTFADSLTTCDGANDKFRCPHWRMIYAIEDTQRWTLKTINGRG